MTMTITRAAKRNYSRFIQLIIFVLFFQMNGVAQNSECGTDFIHNTRMESDAVYKKQVLDLELQVEASIKNHAHNNLKSTIYKIPVVVHVLHLGETIGTGSNISDLQIQQAITGLNNRFNNSNGNGVDVEMEFCLAIIDPNGNPTSGINRVNGTSVANYQTNGITPAGNPCIGGIETSIKDLSRWPVADYYNIWVVSEICNGSFVGYASYPVGGLYDGLVIVSTSMTSNSGTLPHEIGHGFFLYHTFNGDGGNVNCPVDTDCTIDGDRVCDTPPHKQSDCGATNPCTVTGVWDNSRYNYMSYCPLVNRFTQGQKDRMRATAIIAPRASLLTSAGCGILGTNEMSSNQEFSVYPNPTQSNFSIINAAQKPLAIVLLASDGKQLNTLFSQENVILVDLSSHPKGLYLLEINDGSKTEFKRIIKE